MHVPQVVSATEWTEAIEELRVEEKRATRERDALAARRRRLPAVAVEKPYRFHGPDGDVTLLDLFEGRRQLLVYHFMFAPEAHGWPDAGCPGCSMFVDQIGQPAHFHARDTSLALVSRAPLERLEALGSVWTFLDLTPLGRQERWEDSPASVEQEEPYQWWRRHDEYAEVTAR